MRETASSAVDDVLSVERAAFGPDEAANLVKDLIEDPGARPFVSLLAFREARAAVHILFTRAHLAPEAPAINLHSGSPCSGA